MLESVTCNMGEKKHFLSILFQAPSALKRVSKSKESRRQDLKHCCSQHLGAAMAQRYSGHPLIG